MHLILFCHPLAGPRALYLNPIEVQRLVALVAEQFPEVTVDLIDRNAEDNHDKLEQTIAATDVLCLALPNGSMPAALLSLPIGSRLPDSWLILLGEIISDGNPSEALLAAREAGWASNRIIGFVGRDELQFLQLVNAISNGVHPKGLLNVAVLDECGTVIIDESARLAKNILLAKPVFTDSIKQAIADRGLRVLIDGLSRGCEHHCLYCHLNNREQTSGVVQEMYDEPSEVLREVEAWCGTSAVLMFTDENFFGGSSEIDRRNRLEKICQLGSKLVQRKFSGILGVDTRIDTVVNDSDDAGMRQMRESSWKTMAAAGLRYVYLGIESFSHSQLKRYGKSEQLKIVSAALRFLRSLDIKFIAGLIILDPLVTPTEIVDNIRYIEHNDLLGNVASLLKEMRVQQRSKYYRLLEKSNSEIRAAQRDMLMLTRESVPYSNRIVKNAIRITRSVHELFSDSGYRHSDVVAFEALVPEVSSDPSLSVPRVVIKMEIELLKELLQGRSSDDVDWAYGLAKDCAELVLDLIARRKSITNSSGSQKVHRYYQAVFSEVKKKALRHSRRATASTSRF
jgi:radical SAM family protein